MLFFVFFISSIALLQVQPCPLYQHRIELLQMYVPWLRVCALVRLLVCVRRVWCAVCAVLTQFRASAWYFAQSAGCVYHKTACVLSLVRAAIAVSFHSFKCRGAVAWVVVVGANSHAMPCHAGTHIAPWY